MPTKSKTTDDPAELRRCAEARLRDQRTSQRSKTGEPKSAADTARQLHELEVHQIELELQNAELQQTREELEAALDKYTDLYDFAPVGYMTLDHAGDIREANLAVASLLGIARSALVKQRFGRFVAPADRPVFDAFFQKVFENKAREECDVRLLVEDRPPVDVRLRTNVFATGQACRVAVTDITAHQRTEAALRESEEWCRTFFENSSDGVFCLSPNGEIVKVNQAFARMHGYSVAEMLKTSLKDLDTPATSQLFPERMRRILGGNSLAFEVEQYHKDGHTFWLEVTASLITVGGKNYVLASHRDITKRKAAEAQLKASFKEITDLKFALDQHAIVAITDPQGKITYANDKLCAISKYSRAELLGQDHRLVNSGHHPKEFFRDLWTTIAQGRVWHGEIKNKAKDGSFYWVDATIVPLLNDQGKIRQYVAIRTDSTERKRAEADRLILNKLESTGILAGGIAHDFNNLFTIILLNLELAQMLNPPGEELARHLEEAKQTSLLARRLTAQLVTFAEGGAPIRKAMALSGVIQESVRPALSGSQVRCEISLAPDLWLAEVDATQIGQVIRNLVQNAREAMPQGGLVHVRAENVTLSDQELPSLPAGEYVRVSITDQGTGIAEDVQPKIFDPYFSTKQRGNQKGMGLGLTICHSVVQKHNGAIAVKSEVGVGTTFHLYLPAARGLSREEKAAVPAGVLQLGRVLLMDDEEGVRQAVGLALRGLGHEVEPAKHGEMAIEVYKEAKRRGRPLDVVILDLTIRGGMGGLETIRALLKLDPAVKAIAMSGHALSPAILEPERHGFKGVLEKPFDVAKLKEVLSRVMSSPTHSKVAP